jgi:hypothetical protein
VAGRLTFWTESSLDSLTSRKKEVEMKIEA